jgi:gamma-glutamyltranspeptidase / glutathione hydrolase
MNRRDVIRAAGLAGGALALKAGIPLIAVGDDSDIQPRRDIDLSPASWSAEDRERYLKLEQEFNGPHPEAYSTKGMVAGTSNPLAIHAGMVTLRQGGTAADAAICTALTQVSLMFGAATSYAGVLNALYYQASTGKVYAMDACYNTVKNEADPLTIPLLGTPSGRTVLVPGFMAGVQALHNRFANLHFAKLFDPTIWVAERGVPASIFLTKPLASQKQFVTRLPEGKEIFTKPDGETYKEGDVFRQPRLAETLKTIARQGAGYMYHGDWARQLVDAVQSEGGKLTLDDLAEYRANWAEPSEVLYRQYRITSLASPNIGGAITLVAMNLLAAADLKRFGHYTTSAEALYWSIQISRFATMLVNRPADSFEKQLPGIDLSRESLLKQETAKKIWQRMQLPGWNLVMDRLRGPKPATNHSAGVLAVDSQGNMASIVHSINSIGWGTTGIFVGGISIPDSACIQQGTIAKAGPRKPLPGPANPVIVFEEDQAVLGSAAIGSGLHPVTIQNLTNILDFELAPKMSADTPNFMGPHFGTQLTGPAKPEMEKETIGEGDFSEEIIDRVRALGQEVIAVPKLLNRPQLGYWIGIQVNPKTKQLTGGVTPELNARAEGY